MFSILILFSWVLIIHDVILYHSNQTTIFRYIRQEKIDIGWGREDFDFAISIWAKVSPKFFIDVKMWRLPNIYSATQPTRDEIVNLTWNDLSLLYAGPLAPVPIRVQSCVCCLFWTNRNSMAVTFIFLSHYPVRDMNPSIGDITGNGNI